MPLIFANEYDKYENKIGKGIFQDTVKSSISPVIGIVKNKPEMNEDLETFKKIIEETKKNRTTEK